MLQLDDWQKEILECRDKYILLCKGRQVGGTTIFARKCADRLISQPGCKIVVASITEDQAHLVILMILDYLQMNFKKLIARGYKKPTKGSITLINGSNVLSRPVGNTGDSIRGFTGDILYLNEVSRMSELILLAAKPILLTTGGEIWMDSTPFGRKGYFYESYQNKNNQFRIFSVNSEQAIYNRVISESWTEEKRAKAIKFLEDEKNAMSELQYGQEYLGLFVEELRQFFSDELIDKCCIGQRQDLKQGNAYYLGADIARAGGDETAISIIQMISPKNLLHAETITKIKQMTTQTSKEIAHLDLLWKFKRIYIDTGGIGAAVFDQLMIEPNTRNKTEAIDNATKAIDREEGKRKLRKEELYANLLRLMEKGEIVLLNDEKVRLSLKSIQYEYTIKENERSRIKIWGSYSHITESLIRAAWCSQEKSLNLWVRYS